MTFLLLFLVSVYFIFALWRLRLAVLFLPLFFPAYLLQFDINGVPFTLIEAFIDVSFFAWILRLLWMRFFVLRKTDFLMKFKAFFKPQRSLTFLQKFDWKLWSAILLLLVAAIISTLIVPKQVLLADGNTVFYGQRVALGILKGWILTPILMLFLFFAIIRKKSELLWLLNSYLGSCLWLSLWALWQVVTGDYITADGRASGPFESANYLALYVTPAVLYAFIRSKSFFLLSGGLVTLALLFTKSYAALLALALATLFYFGLEYLHSWFHQNKKISWKKIGFVLLCLIILFAIVVLLDPVKWQVFFDFFKRSSSGVRLEIYTIATRLVIENPFMGIGLGQFPAVYQLHGPAILGHVPYEWNVPHPHNLFLAFWLNLGLPGFAAFVWIMVMVFKKVWPFLKLFLKQKANDLQKIRVMGFALFLVILIHGFVDTPFFKNDLALLFWLILAVILVPLSEKE